MRSSIRFPVETHLISEAREIPIRQSAILQMATSLNFQHHLNVTVGGARNVNCHATQLRSGDAPQVHRTVAGGRMKKEESASGFAIT
nr:unnamed protein product [Callosobruchus analis]